MPSGEMCHLFSLENHGFSDEKCMYLKGKYIYYWRYTPTMIMEGYAFLCNKRLLRDILLM